MANSQPVFIVGTGRCGSSIFHDILCHHPQLGWLTQYANRYPYRPNINNWAMRAINAPITNVILNRFLFPAEPYRFWECHCPGFARPYRDLLSADVTSRMKSNVRTVVNRVIPGELRFLAKITGWPRIGLLREIFPDAKFIHIIRDGRAVVNSVISAPYFDGWAGPNNWTRGDMDERQREYWELSGQSFVVLAAIGWENRMKAFDLACNKLPENVVLDIKYEEFCKDPVTIFKNVLEFSGLSYSSYFFKKLKKIQLIEKNDKWKNDLNPQQQEQLNDYLNTVLQNYGYI